MSKRGYKGDYDGAVVKKVKTKASQSKRMSLPMVKAPRMSNARTGGFLGMELKFLDTSYNTALVAAAGMNSLEADPSTFLGLTSIAQGDGESNRDGRQAIVKSVELHGSIVQPVTSDQADAPLQKAFFVALIMDTQTNGAQFNSEDVFLNPSADTNGIVCCQRNLQYIKRFKVLDYVVLTSPPQTIGTDGTNTQTVSGFNIPFSLKWAGSMRVNYTSTTGVIANTVDNSIHVVAGATSSAGTPALLYNARTRFVG